jgi:hypothetical protein
MKKRSISEVDSVACTRSSTPSSSTDSSRLMPMTATTTWNRVVAHSQTARRPEPGSTATSVANGASANSTSATNFDTTTVSETASSTKLTTKDDVIDSSELSRRVLEGLALNSTSALHPAFFIMSRGQSSVSWGPRARMKLRVSAQSLPFLGSSTSAWPQLR